MLHEIDWSDVIGKVIAGLIVAAILAIISWAQSPRFRRFLKRLWNTVIDWLTRQWQYLVVVILLILIEVALYLVYASWWIIAFSIAHLALVMLAVLLLFAPKWPTIVLPGFEDDFRSGLDAWTTPSGWQPTIERRGLQLIPHSNLSNVLILERLPRFVNGVVECEVYLEEGALFNVMLRGSISGDEFYMARLDSRPSNYDCLLIKPKGTGWRPLYKTKHLSPHSQWLKMRVVAEGDRISLYRNKKLVAQIDNAEVKIGRVGFFAECATVYLRKVRVFPYRDEAKSCQV